MTLNSGIGSPRGLLSAAVLAIMGLALGWLCVRTTMVAVLAGNPATLRRIAPGDAEGVLTAATIALVDRHGLLDPATLAAVRRAALTAPLDARAFLILGHQQLLDRQPQRAVATLEAGQRLDPRQSLIHLLLLDRYLRTARYTDAAAQFSVLGRLIGEAQAPIAQAMAAMSLAPATRDAVRRTLRTDPVLERAVLTTLAKSGTAPTTVFALASPVALTDAGHQGSWGPALIDRLVGGGRYTAAHAVWQQVYRLSDADAGAPIFDPGFRASAASPPFDWTLVAGSMGAADLGDSSLAVTYYGRDSGDLASQLLILRPGRYRFSFAVDAGKTDTAAKLFWSLACASGSKAMLMNVAVTATAVKRRIATTVIVPPGCPAQSLTLRGEAGEFPAPIGVTLRDLAMQPVGLRP